MKNKDLTARLSELDPEATVLFKELDEDNGDFGESYPVGGVFEDFAIKRTRVWDGGFKQDYYKKPVKEDDPRIEKVICIMNECGCYYEKA